MGHAVGLVENDPQKALGHLRRQVAQAVGQGLGIAFDVGKRGAQLVGDVGHEVLSLLLLLLQVGDGALQL